MPVHGPPPLFSQLLQPVAEAKDFFPHVDDTAGSFSIGNPLPSRLRGSGPLHFSEVGEEAGFRGAVTALLWVLVFLGETSDLVDARRGWVLGIYWSCLTLRSGLISRHATEGWGFGLRQPMGPKVHGRRGWSLQTLSFLCNSPCTKS